VQKLIGLLIGLIVIIVLIYILANLFELLRASERVGRGFFSGGVYGTHGEGRGPCGVRRLLRSCPPGAVGLLLLHRI